MGDWGEKRWRMWGTKNDYWKRRCRCLEDESGVWGRRGINLRKIEAAGNGGSRGKGACCLIFNRIIFPCIPFIYLSFPHIYSYVNVGCVPAKNHIGVLRWTETALTVHHRYPHTDIKCNPKGISADLSSPAASLDTGRDATDSSSYGLTVNWCLQSFQFFCFSNSPVMKMIFDNMTMCLFCVCVWRGMLAQHLISALTISPYWHRNKAEATLWPDDYFDSLIKAESLGLEGVSF